MEIMRNGKSLRESVMEGAVARLRPILMTALMAGIGLLPAALSHGIGSGTAAPVCGGHRRWHRQRDPVYAVAAAYALSAVCR